MASTKRRKKKRPPMLIALRGRANCQEDEDLRSQLDRVTDKGGMTEAFLIRTGVKRYLDFVERQLAEAPSELAQILEGAGNDR